MTINDYQKEALRTEQGMTKEFPRLLNGLMGLCGEAGEAIDLMKKHLYQGHELDREHMAKELGDVAWYIAISAERDTRTDSRRTGLCTESRGMFKLRRIYPERIMLSLRQSRGLEPNDTSDDDYIMNMEPDRAFAEICRWNGLLGDWCEMIKSWYEGIYEAEEVAYKKPVFDPYDISF